MLDKIICLLCGAWIVVMLQLMHDKSLDHFQVKAVGVVYNCVEVVK